MIDYYSNVRKDILPLIEQRPNQRVLDVGCGVGNTSGYLKEIGLASYVVGIEKELKCSDSVNSLIDEYLWLDVEKDELKLSLPHFDVILLLDVLEHLYDPYKLINRLSSCLDRGGYMIISIPNIRNLSVLKKLIVNGEWEYQDSGILDRTHIRFFTKLSFEERMTCFKLILADYRANYDNSYIAKILSTISAINEFVVCQHIFKFKKKQ
jgi:2-polyprenyl-3-methyl-5-hydroxy-6-metoxy-1,4-benzoquinol methylase